LRRFFQKKVTRPYQRSLMYLYQAIHIGTSPADPIHSLDRIGGAGKSEAAIKFATENQDSFWGVFWIDADDRQNIEEGFADIAKMQVPPLEGTRPRDVLQWLATTKESWLIILDNCDDDRIDFAKYIPSRGGSVIITTRLTECRIHGTWENIDELGKEDATQLLLKASGLEHGDQTALVSVAKSVVSILGQHALALVHAGAYIKRGYYLTNKLHDMEVSTQLSKSLQQLLLVLINTTAILLFNCSTYLRSSTAKDVYMDLFGRSIGPNGLTASPSQTLQTTRSLGRYRCATGDFRPEVNCPFEKMFSPDDGKIYHLGIWHQEKSRISGLIEGQKSKRLRAASIRLADL
ncbi:hypothetical protein KCU62_g478, partial [Aureobasidium sp. EXF-3399]